MPRSAPPRRPRIRRAVGAFVAAACAAVTVLAAAPAEAYVRVAYATRNQVMVENPTGAPGLVRATLVLELAANESHLLRAESVATQGTPDRNAIGQKITCERADGTIVKQSWSGSNMLAARGSTKVTQRLLFTAPTAGTYSCRLRVYVDSHYPTPARAVLVSGFVGDVYGSLGTGPVGTPDAGQTTQYFPAGRTAARTVLVVPHYAPPVGSTAVQGRADVFLTNCYGGGGAGCPLGTFPRSGSSTYAVKGVLVPGLKGACPRVETPRRIVTFDSDTHHIGSTVDAIAQFPASAKCTYTYYVTVEWLKGLPFVVQLYPYSQASLLAS